MNDLRIQIVNYRTKQYLIDCIESMREELEQADFSYSFALLDNASGDNLSDIPERFPWLKNTEIIQGDKNLGFGAGHNVLAKRGDAKYLLILNPDLKFIEPDTIGRLLRAIKETGSQVVGPRLINAGGKVQAWDHGEIRGIIARLAVSFGSDYWRKRKSPAPATWVSGAVMLISKEWFDNVGGFDDHFFLYKEENDLCLRIREIGGRVIYDPTVNVFHHSSVVAKKSEQMRASADYYFEKHYRNRRTYPLLKIAHRILHCAYGKRTGTDPSKQ